MVRKWKREKSHNLGKREEDGVMEERLSDHFLKLNKVDPKEGYLPRSLYRQSDAVNHNHKI